MHLLPFTNVMNSVLLLFKIYSEMPFIGWDVAQWENAFHSIWSALGFFSSPQKKSLAVIHKSRYRCCAFNVTLNV